MTEEDITAALKEATTEQLVEELYDRNANIFQLLGELKMRRFVEKETKRIQSEIEGR